MLSLFIKKGFSSATMHSFLDSHRLSLKIRLTQLICYIYHIVHGQDSTNRCIDLLQVLGALWYILAIQREDTCWREACNNQDGCDLATLYCGSTAFGNNTFLQDACSTNGGADVDPIFGIYLPVLQNVSQSTGFFEKLFYCFWWGLQNLWYTPNPHTHTTTKD